MIEKKTAGAREEKEKKNENLVLFRAQSAKGNTSLTASPADGSKEEKKELTLEKRDLK